MENIRPVNEANIVEDHLSKMLVTTIRFEALVKMFDVATRSLKSGVFNTEERPLPPQYFVIEHTLTLESIKNETPHQLGMRLKEMYGKLETHIEQYKLDKT